MTTPVKQTEVRTLGELRAALADHPDSLPVQTDCSMTILVQHWPAEPASANGEWDAMPERIDLVPPFAE